MCKVCTLARQRDYRQRNAALIKEKSRRRYASNPEPSKLRARAWEKANPERKSELNKKWALENADRVRELRRLNVKRNADREAERQKAWAVEHPGRKDEHTKKWRSINKEKARCHHQLQKAVREGRVLKSNSCQTCGAVGIRIEGHHPDYSKPLAVIWLCHVCHKNLHLEQRDFDRTLERKSA